MINHVYQLVSPGVFSVKYSEENTDSKVIIRPNYMALCHADQRYYRGLRDIKVLSRKLPMALIHECCGTVIKDNTGSYKIGQKVVMIPNVPPEIPQDGIYENYAKGSYFLSSGHDGFMREFVAMTPDRVVPYNSIEDKIASISEFVSVGVHATDRFFNSSHQKKEVIGVWGDGSLAYVVCCILSCRFPKSRIVVVGRNMSKLTRFSFAYKTYMADNIPADLLVDHAFECAGGEGSYYAIDDIIRYINPQGTVMLMGVSENRVAINTRDVLEKGLTLIGSSRSGRADFQYAVELMENQDFQTRLSNIISEETQVSNIEDIHRVFQQDLNTLFKTVFHWDM